MKRVSVLLLALALIAGMAACSQPAPPAEDVEIQTWYDLDNVRNDLGGSYILMNDLSAETAGYDELVSPDHNGGLGWEPIGTSADRFTGSFDGQGYEISDLYINRPDEDGVGLFGYVQQGIVKNVGLVSVNVTGNKSVGALVGYSWKGTLDSDTRPPLSMTYSQGTVTGEEDVGGLVGNSYDGTVNQCESSAHVFHISRAPDEDRWRAGGLVGLNSGTVLNCDYNGEVNGDRQVGGLVGHNAILVALVEDCGGAYEVYGNLEVGGVAGRNMGSIRRASFAGEVNGILIGNGLVALSEDNTGNADSSHTALAGSYIGGVAGVNEGTLEDCSAEVTVSGYAYVGGLVGSNNGTVQNCISDSNVTGASHVGGLVGANRGNVGSCTSSGDVTGEYDTGCLVGFNTGTVSDSDSTSWVIGTSDGGDLVGRNEGVVSGVSYDLRVSSTSGGSVTTPGEGTFAYDYGAAVDLVAEAEEGYCFVSWTGDAGTIASVNAAATSITMNGDYEVIASFEATPPITFAIAGPMTDFRGQHQWWGAEMVRDEINAGAGVNVGGVFHRVELVQIDTDEMMGAPEKGVSALEAVIDDVDFVLGGWRTDVVAVYREVAMEAQRIFMGCGPATGLLQYSVVSDYDHYKYWFKITPYNELFLVTSLFKMTSTIGAVLQNTLLSYGDAVAEDYRVPEDSKPRVAILMEDTPWFAEMVTSAQHYLPLIGFTVTGTWLVSPTQSDISTELSQIAATKPHIIFTMFTSSTGAAYSVQKHALGIPAMTIGINVVGERKDYWASTDGKCNGEIILDTWAEGLQYTVNTTTFLDAFMAKTGEYPTYTTATFDAIYSLKEAIESVSAIHGWDDIADVVDPASIDALIQCLETSSYTGTVSQTSYYPMPDIDLGGGVYALSETQVRSLYPDLATYDQNQWLCAASTGPHIAHDIVYGPGYATGIGCQWQDGHKVGVWPMDLGRDYDAALTDQYGNWNFEYQGTKPVLIPIEGFLKS